EFEKERVLLCIEYSDKDENGKPKIFSDPSRGSQYEIVSRREEFDKEIKTLKDKHKGSIESKEKLDAEFNKLLDQDEYIDIHKVDLSDVPKDISVQALNGILPMISEE
ncbi:MAG: hypothetical protein GY700_01595, partial [Propionibacteriaceae bacterium]|nr:hypothetical protein [Propionibacteriaceae bacterium]